MSDKQPSTAIEAVLRGYRTSYTNAPDQQEAAVWLRAMRDLEDARRAIEAEAQRSPVPASMEVTEARMLLIGEQYHAENCGIVAGGDCTCGQWEAIDSIRAQRSPVPDGLREALLTELRTWGTQLPTRAAAEVEAQQRADLLIYALRAALGAPSASEVPSVTDATERRDSLAGLIAKHRLMAFLPRAECWSDEGVGVICWKGDVTEWPQHLAAALLAADAPRSTEP